MELELVEELRRVAAHHVEELRRPLDLEVLRLREVEPLREPRRIVGQMLHEHRPALGDRDVAEALLLHDQVGRGVRVVLRVPGLVEERAPVVGAAHRLDDEDDAAGHLDRRAERSRALLRPLLDVELDVLLRFEVDAEVGERRLERGHHLLRRELRIPLGRAERADHVPALRLVQPDADAPAEELVRGLLVELLRRVEQVAALVGELVEPEAEATVELRVVRRFELRDAFADDAHSLAVERVQVLLGQVDADLVEPCALVAVGLVRHRRAQHPEGDRLAVDRRLEARLELGDLLRVLAGELAEVALGREAPELADAPVAVGHFSERLRLLELGQLGVALVDRGQLELLLETGVVEVELLVELRDEPVGTVAEAVEVGLGQRGSGVRHRPQPGRGGAPRGPSPGA